MSKNEIVARWMGSIREPLGDVGNLRYYSGKGILGGYHKNFRYNKNYQWLMPAWVKFRDLNRNGSLSYKEHDSYKERIERAITRGSITEAFDELVKGIEWYQSLKK